MECLRVGDCEEVEYEADVLCDEVLEVRFGVVSSRW